MIVAWLALMVGAAPRLLLALAGASTVQTLIIFLVTLRWKISGHAAAITGLAVLSWLLASPVVAPAALSVPLVIWARLRLRRHTFFQALAGAAVGALISVAVHWVGR
jgi:membrane-associated phospholipid phosphatase